VQLALLVLRIFYKYKRFKSRLEIALLSFHPYFLGFYTTIKIEFRNNFFVKKVAKTTLHNVLSRYYDGRDNLRYDTKEIICIC